MTQYEHKNILSTIKDYPLKVLWQKSYYAQYNKLFDVFYTFCKVEDRYISLHGEMNIQSFYKTRQNENNNSKIYKCEYESTPHGLVQKAKKYIGLGADPRIVSDGKNCYAYVIGYGKAKHPAFLYCEKDDSLHPLHATEDFEWGKNWQPFIKNEKLFIVHELMPYSIYEIDLITYSLKQVVYVDSDFGLSAHFTNHTMFRGGSNAIAKGEFVYGIGRASAQPYKHIPFFWSSFKGEFPIIQFTDFFNSLSKKGFSIIDPTSFFEDEDGTVYIGLACSQTCWFYEQEFLNILLVVECKSRYPSLPTLNEFLIKYEDFYQNKHANLENHLFFCDKLQHEIPYKNEYGVLSTGTQGMLVYGPYIEIEKSMYLSVELSYLTLEEEGKEAGIFDINLSKMNSNNEMEFIQVVQSPLKTTNKEIDRVVLIFDTTNYIGYSIEFRVFVKEGYNLNAFHIKTKKITKDEENIFLDRCEKELSSTTPLESNEIIQKDAIDLSKHIFKCEEMQHDIPYHYAYGVKSRGQSGFLVYGPYIEIYEAMHLSIELSYLSKSYGDAKIGTFDINLSKDGCESIKVQECELKATNKEIQKAILFFDTTQYIGYKAEFRVFVEEGHEVHASHIYTKKINSEDSVDLLVSDLREKKKNMISKLKKEIRYRFYFFKNLFKNLGVYGNKKYDTKIFKNVFLRKFWKFFGLYPNIRMLHFYYERANSFMAPKAYEYRQMFKGVKLKKSDVILDLGCGDGTLLFAIGKSVKKVIGLDIGVQGIQDAKFKAKELSKKIESEFICSKIEEANLKEESLDKIVSFSVIEHIPNYMEVFEEIFRLLKKDGELIISVDSFSHFDKKQREIHRKNFDVVKYFEKDELHELLQKIGFKEIQIKPIFKSKFAEKWFTRVMNNPSEYFGSFKRLYSFILYYQITYHENKVKQNDHGIFLIVKCKK